MFRKRFIISNLRQFTKSKKLYIGSDPDPTKRMLDPVIRFGSIGSATFLATECLEWIRGYFTTTYCTQVHTPILDYQLLPKRKEEKRDQKRTGEKKPK